MEALIVTQMGVMYKIWKIWQKFWFRKLEFNKNAQCMMHVPFLFVLHSVNQIEKVSEKLIMVFDV